MKNFIGHFILSVATVGFIAMLIFLAYETLSAFRRKK